MAAKLFGSRSFDMGISKPGARSVQYTVQEKAITRPTDARLTHRVMEKLVDLSRREGVDLRQSFLRVAQRAAIMVGRYPCR
jgi:hypothetical protein